jgi:sulfur carrier protein
MRVTVNAEEVELGDPGTVAELLEQCGYGDARVAVAVNEEFVPRSTYAGTKLNDGDRVDVVAPMQGG